MVATVIGREHRSGTDWLYLDVGVFQGLIEPLEMSGWKYPIFTKKHARGYKKSFVLTGPTCDAYDTLGLDYMLPSDINVGDELYIGATGAYSLVYASHFNGFEPPKTYYVKGKE
jgi:ornithine decarboxylase